MNEIPELARQHNAAKKSATSILFRIVSGPRAALSDYAWVLGTVPLSTDYRASLTDALPQCLCNTYPKPDIAIEHVRTE